ncbi:tripartite tricarboxylate transporter substrate binding protein [Paucibacter sp. O1-1]|nr:tripartite tricarboxylate transporter substrate binding protein [Paucibacter sp. O1-1]MDA3825076.1 tripartite tricarboxylate transporter substrate binding protein [Paucibacter sp. O1-1]
MHKQIKRAFLAMAFTATLTAQAQSSGKPVTIVVPFGAGGSTDVLTRVVAARMSLALNRPVIVDNKPGAGSRLAAGQVKNMAADGSVLLMALTTTASIAPVLYEGQVNYDFKRDYTPVAQVAKAPLVLSVGDNSKFKSAQDLVTYAKEHPGKLNVGTSGVGTMAHLTLYRLGKATNAKIEMIPFRGGSSVVNDLLAGQLDGAMDTLGDHLEHHRGKKMRILGVFSSSRSNLLPDVPTMAEQGVGTGESETWFGLFVPAKTPAAAVTELQNAVAVAMQDSEVQARLNGLGIRPSYLGSAEFGRVLSNDAAFWGALVRESGIKPE